MAEITLEAVDPLNNSSALEDNDSQQPDSGGMALDATSSDAAGGEADRGVAAHSQQSIQGGCACNVHQAHHPGERALVLLLGLALCWRRRGRLDQR